MRVLVTGGAGFIGSHTCERLVAMGREVVCLDNFDDYYPPADKRENLSALMRHQGFWLVEGDIRDRSALDRAFSLGPVDALVHLAAMAGVRRSVEMPELYTEVNVLGSLRLLEAAKYYGVRTVVLASSSSVYGSRSTVPFREDDPIDAPLSPYAATKRSMELLGYVYWRLHGISVTVLRFFTVYGPRGRPDMAPYLFTRAILEGRPVQVFGDGSAKRDYTFIDDAVDGILAAITRSPAPYRIYNIGSSRPISLLEFISVIERVTGSKALVTHAPERPGDVPITYADLTRAYRELGYWPKIGIEEGLRKLAEWLRPRTASNWTK
jgi:UDP-glucuronate 4-epimerase